MEMYLCTDIQMDSQPRTAFYMFWYLICVKYSERIFLIYSLLRVFAILRDILGGKECSWRRKTKSYVRGLIHVGLCAPLNTLNISLECIDNVFQSQNVALKKSFNPCCFSCTIWRILNAMAMCSKEWILANELVAATTPEKKLIWAFNV